MLELPGSILLALRLRDKFGDQGIVGLVLAVPTGHGMTLAVDSFLVSCRALGRGVEEALWAAMVNRAIDRAIAELKPSIAPPRRTGWWLISTTDSVWNASSRTPRWFVTAWSR